MKKAILAILSIIAVCSICFAGTVNAYSTGYSCPNYQTTAPTLNGGISPANEWDDSYKDYLYSGWTMTTNLFRIKWYSPDFVEFFDYWLIEILSDTTNDAGDLFTICYDGSADGAGAPVADSDYRVDYTGGTTTIYEGTGTGWAAASGIDIPGQVQVVSTIAASPASATPHRIIELKFDKSGAITGAGINTAIRLSYTDASNAAQGELMWPPNSQRDVSTNWGFCEAQMTGEIPEGLTIGVMMALSSVAVVVSMRYFRKPKKL